MLEIFLSSGEPVLLKQVSSSRYKESRIPGSLHYLAERTGFHLYLQVLETELFTLTLRQFRFYEPVQLVFAEPPQPRLEIPLSGVVSIRTGNSSYLSVPTGQYRFTDEPRYGAVYATGDSLLYFTLHFPMDLLSTANPTGVISRGLCPLPLDMLNLVHAVLKCPFAGNIRDFYYSNKARELLFMHLVSLPVALPGELNAEQIALMYEADRIMADNLDGKITIPELAKQLGINFVSLKRNYEKVFGIGIFPRLMQRKMEHIQLLLEKTNRPLKDIADLAGYQTLPGFINAFRKRFKVTPREWRNQRRGL